MRQSPFSVNVAALRLEPGTRRPVRRRGPITGLRVTGSSVADDAVVDVDVVLEGLPRAVVARGVVAAPWQGECRRCLRPVEGELRSEVVELFEEGHDPEQTYPLAGDELDLEPLARESVLLELPQVPLCRDACEGLCPYCGAELNEGPCGCEAVEGDPRWAALDALRET